MTHATKPNRALRVIAVLVLLLILAAVVRAVRIDREYMSGWLLTVAYAGGLVAVLVALIVAAAKARTRGGRAVSLAAALLFLLLVLVGVPLVERLPALLYAAAEALRSIGA